MGKKNMHDSLLDQKMTQSFARCSFILAFDHKVDLAASVND